MQSYDFSKKNQKIVCDIVSLLKEKLSEFGYSYRADRKKIKGRIQVMYYVDKEWLEQENIDNEFMLLVEAHDGE